MNKLLAFGLGALGLGMYLDRRERAYLEPKLDRLEESTAAAIAQFEEATGPFHTQVGGTLDEEIVAEGWHNVEELRAAARASGSSYAARRMNSMAGDLAKALKRYEKSVEKGWVFGGG